MRLYSPHMITRPSGGDPNFVLLIRDTLALVKRKGPVGAGMKMAASGLVGRFFYRVGFKGETDRLRPYQRSGYNLSSTLPFHSPPVKVFAAACQFIQFLKNIPFY